MEKEWSDVTDFVSELKTVLDEEAKIIRETNLDQDGEYRAASLKMKSLEDGKTWPAETTDVFVDVLGRVILPAKERYEDLKALSFIDEGNGNSSPKSQKVVQVERRFRGQKIVAYVVYLEE